MVAEFARMVSCGCDVRTFFERSHQWRLEAARETAIAQRRLRVVSANSFERLRMQHVSNNVRQDDLAC